MIRPRSPTFPPPPVGLKGRKSELRTLCRAVMSARPSRVALVGTGGSGKSMLACALGHRVKARFPGGIHWFRVGAWDAGTLGEMLAIRFGTPRARATLFSALRKHLAARGPTLVVLDNHEDDRAVARLLDELRNAPVSWVITARRCLLGGVSVFPVIAPHAAGDRKAFPRVATLTNLLRKNPLALDIADGMVAKRAISATALGSWLEREGVERVRVLDHEDDLPEVALLVRWAWMRLGTNEKRIMTVLAHAEGDHVDKASLLALAKVRDQRSGQRALDALRAWHLVQCPFEDRYALHAVVRHAVLKRTHFARRRIHEHYLTLLEREPERLDLEQTHLYAAMDFAHAESNLAWALRVDRLTAKLAEPFS